ncbi:MAG: tRNA dihydrouridine synthase DusB [Eubacteriales bacterium]|nr:tRNA dihydrouridine synthase DusB [Eubacteriales bacterium]
MKADFIPVLSLAPMAGMTDWPMRVLCYRMGAEYACSEMVSAVGFMCAKPDNLVYRQLLKVHQEETATACQLFGKDPTVMGEAAQRITELGRFASLDINMGCPARKVVSIGEGSALLLNPEQAYRVMEAVKRNTTLPVTIKTRLGFDGDSMNATLLGEAAQSLGFQWMALHGRTRQQQYAGHADYEAIASVRQRLSIPVIANGDVFEPEDAPRILKETGCSGLMIGRGAMGNPWLFRGARQCLRGEAVTPVSLEERIAVARLHMEWMTEYKGERLGVLEMRKHIGHYISGIRGAGALRREMNAAKTKQEMDDLLERLLDDKEELE